MKKVEFLAYLRSEFNLYCLISDIDIMQKQEKKQFINGLMRASRFFGVNFDELKSIVDSELTDHINDSSNSDNEEDLHIPSFIRQNKKLEI